MYNINRQVPAIHQLFVSKGLIMAPVRMPVTRTHRKLMRWVIPLLWVLLAVAVLLEVTR